MSLNKKSSENQISLETYNNTTTTNTTNSTNAQQNNFYPNNSKKQQQYTNYQRQQQQQFNLPVSKYQNYPNNGNLNIYLLKAYN